MKNKVIKAKEQAANLLMTSQQTQQERDELMKKLERAKVMEQYNNVVQISNENSVDEDNVSISDVRYVLIYRNIVLFVQYRDTILAFGCIDTLEWTV